MNKNSFSLEREKNGQHTKHSTSRVELRERIILAAVELFTQWNKSITMDEMPHLWVSLSALSNEVFPDKETLLEECILKSQKDGDIFVKGVIETSGNVLEVLLRCYQWSIERFHATNKKFFEDIKKYPKAYQLMKNNRNRSSEDTVNFFKEGVKQGIFRDDVNFAIINLLVRDQLDLLMNSDICNEYSFLEVYESIMFTFLRGISTEKGARVLEDFICEYRKNQVKPDETKE